MYQLGLSAPEYLPLLKFALSADTLADSLVIIALDWTRPWKFLESFQRWISVLEYAIDEICKEGSAGENWSRGKAIVDELREKGKRREKGDVALFAVKRDLLTSTQWSITCKHIQSPQQTW